MIASPTSSPTRIIYTLHGPKTVDKSDPHPFGPPLPGAPIIRQTFPTSPHAWSSEQPPPYVATINRSDSIRRVSRQGSSPYARPPSHRPTQPVPPTPPNSASGSYTWQDARRVCMERIQLELKTISIIDTNAICAVERERDRYRMTAEAAQRDLRRVTEERDSLREQFEALSLKIPDSTSPTPSNDFVQKFSSAGPLRRNSIPRSFLRPDSASRGQSRCKSADPYLLPRAANDCFDVTYVGRPLPLQRNHHLATKSEPSSPDLIRDASHRSRPCHPTTKPGEIDLEHLDIMYIPYNGRLFCRACHVNRHKLNDFSIEVKSCPNNSNWEDLRDHYLTAHPDESQEIGRLKAATVTQLRQLLGEKQSSSS
ncbi:hypothetical protein D9756_001075 [Leucocoprinus leucothites]|uniref:Uncharacterized protein n=1 Tax=Leucocoprinus leucothites TaxID=201217 RepID=A0A8H5LN85_9AGAR|nr:hypothetical protein D9756_001075 [Leucoagaricus leucothites]